MNEILLKIRCLGSLRDICRIAWEREESTLAPVMPVVRTLRPNAIISMSSEGESTCFSESPTMFTFYAVLKKFMKYLFGIFAHKENASLI